MLPSDQGMSKAALRAAVTSDAGAVGGASALAWRWAEQFRFWKLEEMQVAIAMWLDIGRDRLWAKILTMSSWSLVEGDGACGLFLAAAPS